MTTSAVRLTGWSACGGCAAKWGGAPLSELVGALTAPAAPALLVGLAPFDDAAVYQVAEDVALVSTTDFFPPLVDDPADFGAIAAANACSDVFAMGARVLLALNVAAFPEELADEVVATVLAAAAETVTAAGGTVAGGHTIRSAEPIFGLAVQGMVHPERVIAKGGARPGDVLVLSKPVGTGIVLAGGNPDDVAVATAGMRALNRAASEALVAHHAAVHAATDVSGFGLAGHAWEMAERSGAAVAIALDEVPLYPGALAAAASGTRTGGDARNREYLAQRLVVPASAHEARVALALDPQTSGGLLASVAPEVVEDLAEVGFIPVGEVLAGEPAVLLS
jgi:selenide,water dikinase